MNLLKILNEQAKAKRVNFVLRLTVIAVSAWTATSLISATANAKGASCESVYTKSASQILLPSGTETWVTRNGRKLYARVDGPADAEQTILLLNGLDRELTYWEPFISGLSPNYRIIRLDMWGQGRTLEANGLGEQMKMEDIVKDVDAVLSQVGSVGPLTVIGHSFGGGVGMSMLKQSRHLIRELFLLAPFVPHLEEAQPFVGDAINLARTSLSMMGVSGSLYDSMFNNSMRPFMQATHWMNELTPKTPLQTEAVVQLTIAVREANVYESLKDPGVPVSVFVAGGDSILPRSALENLFAAINPLYQGMYVLMRAGSHYIPEKAVEAAFASQMIDQAIQGTLVINSGSIGDGDLRRREISFKSPKGLKSMVQLGR